MIAFIGEHKDSTAGGLRWGVEPMCTVLTEHGIEISASTYYEWAPTARQVRDEEVVAVMVKGRTTKALVAALGSRKMWLYLRAKGHDVARCTIERLYREQGWEGARYGKKPRTRLGRRRRTRADHLVLGPLVQRDPATRPLRRHPASRVRSSVLCCPTSPPRRGRNPIERASTRPRVVHCDRWSLVRYVPRRCCIGGRRTHLPLGPVNASGMCRCSCCLFSKPKSWGQASTVNACV